MLRQMPTIFYWAAYLKISSKPNPYYFMSLGYCHATRSHFVLQWCQLSLPITKYFDLLKTWFSKMNQHVLGFNANQITNNNYISFSISFSKFHSFGLQSLLTGYKKELILFCGSTLNAKLITRWNWLTHDCQFLQDSSP